MLWPKYVTPAQAQEREAAADATDRRVDALQNHQKWVLDALDRELELYRLTITAQKDRPRDAQRRTN